MDSRVALRFQASSPSVFQEREFIFETVSSAFEHCMHPGLLAVQPHRSMATLSVEGESGLVRGEASVPERLAASAGMGHGHGLRDESDQACSIINSSPKSDLGVSACFGGRGGCNLRCVLSGRVVSSLYFLF